MSGPLKPRPGETVIEFNERALTLELRARGFGDYRVIFDPKEKS